MAARVARSECRAISETTSAGKALLKGRSDRSGSKADNCRRKGDESEVSFRISFFSPSSSFLTSSKTHLLHHPLLPILPLHLFPFPQLLPAILTSSSIQTASVAEGGEGRASFSTSRLCRCRARSTLVLAILEKLSRLASAAAS